MSDVIITVRGESQTRVAPERAVAHVNASVDGAARAAIVLAVQSFTHSGLIADTSVAWDDASFSTVPAPAATALLGLGLLTAGRRRR